MHLTQEWRIDTGPEHQSQLINVKDNKGFCPSLKMSCSGGYSWPAVMLRPGWWQQTLQPSMALPLGSWPLALTILADQNDQEVLRGIINEEQEAGCPTSHEAKSNVLFGWRCICVSSCRRETMVLGHWVGFLKRVSNWCPSLKNSRNFCKT